MEEIGEQLRSDQTRPGREYWPPEKVNNHFFLFIYNNLQSVISCFVLLLCISSFYIFSLISFDDCVSDLRDWLKQVELDLRSEPVLGAESQHGSPDTTEELQRLENLHKELLERRYFYSL